MSEFSVQSGVEIVSEPEGELAGLLERQMHALGNIGVIKEILDEFKNPGGGILVETLSYSLDIGGFFMDETHSDPRYRERMFVGPNCGDALAGKNARLVKRLDEERERLQIEVDFSDTSEPILGYFKLDDILRGCRISKLPIAH